MNESGLISSIADLKQRRLANILQKNLEERAPQQIHELSLAFKKRIVEIREISEPRLLSQCVQQLILTTQKDCKISELVWIYVFKGQFYFHEMVYSENEYLSIGANQFDNVRLGQNSIFAVLTKSRLERAKHQNDLRLINQQKKHTKKFIFREAKIREKDFNIFWDQMIIMKISKNQEVNFKDFDDIIFIIIQGRLTIQLDWKRKIKIREIGSGAIFSSYLGRYIYKIGQNKETSVIPKYNFRYLASQPSIIMGFSPDIFYENQRFFQFRYVVKNSWNTYVQRVEEVNRVIEKVGSLKPEKKDVVKDIKRKLQEEWLKERAISVPIAIERRKFRKIIYNFFEEKSNRRKVPNKAATQSARTIRSFQSDTKQLIREPLYQIKYKLNTDRIKRSKTLDALHESSKKDNLRSTTTMKSTNKSTSLLFKYNSAATLALESPSKITAANFFKPDQFLSRKLRLQYQFICKKAEKLHLPVGNAEHEEGKKQFKNDKEYFENYINERRIIKLGPKKRLLYKQRKGF